MRKEDIGILFERELARNAARLSTLTRTERRAAIRKIYNEIGASPIGMEDEIGHFSATPEIEQIVRELSAAHVGNVRTLNQKRTD